MAISLTSPNVDNYYVGKGIVSVKFEGEPDYTDIGNVTSMEFTPEIEKLDHFSSREGIKTKDRSIVISKSATIKMVMEEWTARNLSMMLLADVLDSGDVHSVDIFSTNVKVTALKFTGTNEVGPKWNFDFPRVEFAPSGAINPISDEWGQLEITGEVVTVNGSFGIASATFPSGS